MWDLRAALLAGEFRRLEDEGPGPCAMVEEGELRALPQILSDEALALELPVLQWPDG
jgi:hypothetical protein